MATPARMSAGICAPVDAEADAAHHRERDAGLVAHEAGEVQQAEQQDGADAQGQQNLPAAEAQGKQSDGEGVVAEAVHVVGPQGEDAVGGPAATLRLGRGEVLVVEGGLMGCPDVLLAASQRASTPMDGWVALLKPTAVSGAGSTPVNGVVCIVISLLEDVFHSIPHRDLCRKPPAGASLLLFHNAEVGYRVVK